MFALPVLRRLPALVPLLVAASAPAQAVPASSNAGGRATVLNSLSILRQADLDFGELIVSGAGTATIDPVTGAVSTTGLVTPAGTGARRALFTTTGSRNSVINIRIPQGALLLTRVGGTETLSVSSWTLDGAKNRKIPLTSTIDFGVGATITVPAGQADGTYVGAFNVTVQYP